MLIENKIIPVEHVIMSYSQEVHPYHLKFGDDALVNWDIEKQRKPELFNGNVLLFSGFELAFSKMVCIGHSVPYSTYLHWRASGDKIGFHIFPLPLMVSSEGHPILGKMAAHTFHGGEHYSPSGSLDEDDVVGDLIDPFANMAREVQEETDLDLLCAQDISNYYIYAFDNKVALFKVFKLPMTSAEILSYVNRFIENDPAAELEKVVAVADPASYPARMTPHMKPILDWYFEKFIG